MQAFLHLGRNDKHGWDVIVHLLRQRPSSPDTLGELEEALREV